jgi:hypothetical protein
MNLEEIFQQNDARVRANSAVQLDPVSQTQKLAAELTERRRRMAADISPKLEEVRQRWQRSVELFKQHAHESAVDTLQWPDAPALIRAAFLHVSRKPPGLVTLIGGIASQFSLSAEGDLSTGIIVFVARDVRTNTMTILDSFPAAEVAGEHAEQALERFVRWILERE